jgi:uncharacterized protein involved in exopolysaccharide biosynthesis
MTAPRLYRADEKIMVADSKNSSAANPIEAAASFAGLSLAGGGNQEALAVLRSKDLAREFISAKSIEGEFDKSWYIKKIIKRKLGLHQFDIEDAVNEFDLNVRSVSEDRKTGVVTLSIYWKDASQAADWANEFVTFLNEQMRRRVIKESEFSINYLQSQLDAQTNMPIQQAASKIIESQLQKLVIARSREQFAFKVIDQAVRPRRPIWPRAGVLIVVSTIGAVVLALISASRLIRAESSRIFSEFIKKLRIDEPN